MNGYDRHHLYWCRRDYRTPVEKKFRALACNIVYIPRAMHEWVEHEYGPPTKPTREYMLSRLDAHKRGECPVCDRRQGDG